jgi:hypothetical protein
MRFATALLATVLLSACASPPVGNSAGRVDSSTVTPADAASDHVLNASLVELADRCAEDIVAGLAQHTIYGVTDNDELITVFIGDIDNRTRGTVSSNDMEMVARRIRVPLIRSGATNQKLSFRENRARTDNLSARERGSGAVEREMTDPKYTYFLNGAIFRTGTAQSIHYYMEFQLTNELTGEMPWIYSSDENRN